MKKFTRHLSLLLAMVFVLSLGVFTVPQKAAAAEVKTYIGDMTISISGINWTDSSYTQNHLMFIKSGSALNGAYFDRIYAVYDSAKGGYVVTEKAGTHCTYSKTVASGAIGLAISYQPLGNTGEAFTRENWKVWQQIRVGDILTFSGFDVSTGTITTSGTFGSSNFVSNAKVHVTTVRDDAATKTGYSGKTIVALGDSVTAGGRWTEETEIALNTRIVNAGTPGARTDEGLGYFATHVAPYNPDIVFIKYAINDTAQYTIAESNLTNFKNNLRELCDMCLEIGALPILITTNKIRLSDSSKYSVVGGLYTFYPRFITAIKEVAAEYDTYCIDLYNQVWASLTADSTTLMDSVHPSGSSYAKEIAYITKYLKDNEDGIIAAANAVSGDVVGMPSATTNYALSSQGGQYMYDSTYPGGSSYYTTAYYGDNSNQGGSYISGKLNDGTTPADSIPNANNTNWAVFFASAATPTVTLKLNSKVYINNVSVLCLNGSGSGITYVAPTVSAVYLSDDGTNFTPTTAFTNKMSTAGTISSRIKLAFTKAVSAKYVRIVFATPTDRTAIGEVQVWGDTSLFGVENDPFELIDGSKHALDDAYATVKALGVSVTALKAEFKCEISLFDASGKALADASYIGTGCTVIQYDTEGQVLNSVTVVIPGDLSGDGNVNTTDMAVVRRMLDSSGSTEVQTKAADITNDNIVNTTDYLTLRKHCDGSSTMY